MRSEKPPLDETALKLAGLLHVCPFCKSELVGHHYARFATAVPGEGQTAPALDLFKAIKEHRWVELQEFQAWESQSDDLEAYAVRCNTTGEIGLAMIRSPQGYYPSNQLVDLEVLSVENGKQLELLIEHDKWRPINQEGKLKRAFVSRLFAVSGEKKWVTKFIFNILGTFFVGLGILGAILPLLPATPFLLLASACYVRGSDRLHGWLMGNKYLGAYIINIRDKRGMPRRAKVITLIVLWASLLISMMRIDPLILKLCLPVVGIGVTTLILKLKTLEE